MSTTSKEPGGFELVAETIPRERARKLWRRPQGRYGITYIALGAGTQSSALYVMATRARHVEVPRVDLAVFADTGDEPRRVYEQLDRLEQWGKRHNGPRIMRVMIKNGKSLSALMETHYIPIPAFTLSSGRRGMLRRQCTTEMKIKPINEWIREHELGIPAGTRARKDQRALALKGFSVEEIVRVKPSQDAWLDVGHPLIDAGLYRWHCQQMLEDEGLGRFIKSACVYCPYRGDREWVRMKSEDPEDFEKACQVDEAIRLTARKGQHYEYVHEDGSMASRRIGDPEPVSLGRNTEHSDALYVHPSCKPLREVDFGDQSEAFANDCSGYCGV